MTNREAINDQNENDQFWSHNKRPQISHQRSPNQKWSLICGFWSFFLSLISHFLLVLISVTPEKCYCFEFDYSNLKPSLPGEKGVVFLCNNFLFHSWAVQTSIMAEERKKATL